MLKETRMRSYEGLRQKAHVNAMHAYWDLLPALQTAKSIYIDEHNSNNLIIQTPK